MTPSGGGNVPGSNRSLLLDISQYSGTSVVSVDPNYTTWILQGSGSFSTGWSRFPGGSLDFEGSGDNGYLKPSSTSTLNETFDGDFTVTCWTKKTGSTYGPIFDFRNTTEVIQLWNQSDGTWIARAGTSAEGEAETTSAIANGDHHVALVRSGQVITLYIDGVAEASYDPGLVRSITFDSASYKNIGAYEQNPTTYNFDGSIADFAIANGTAVWTSNFTPPASNVAYFQAGGTLTLPSANTGDLAYNTANGDYYYATGANSWTKIIGHDSALEPTDGQVATWNNAASRWEFSDFPVDSVNGQTGAVSLRVEDLSNVDEGLLTASWVGGTTSSMSGGMVSGQFFSELYTLNVHPTSQEGDQKDRLRAWIATLPATTNLTVAFDGVEHVIEVNVVEDNMDDVAAYKPRLRLADGPYPIFNANDEFVGQTLVIREYDAFLNANYGGPADGEVLTWVDSEGKWKAAVPPTSIIDSVNGQTGVVNLSTNDLSDTQTLSQVTLTFTQFNASPTLDSDFRWNAAADIFYYIKGGINESYFSLLEVGDVVEWVYDTNTISRTVTQVQTDSALTGYWEIHFDTSGMNTAWRTLAPQTATSPKWLENPTDGQVLTWVDSNSRWEAVDAAGAVTSVNGEIGNVVLDLEDLGNTYPSTTTPTDGQVLTWVDADSEWQPVDATGDVLSVNGYVGTVNLGLEDLNDVAQVGFDSTSINNTWGLEVVTQYNGGDDYPDSASEWASYVAADNSTAYLMLSPTDSVGTDHSSTLNTIVSNVTDYSLIMYVNDRRYGSVTLTAGVQQTSDRYRFSWDASDLDPALFNHDGYSVSNPSSGGVGPYPNVITVEIGLTANLAETPDDGQVLTWNGATNRWEALDAGSITYTRVIGGTFGSGL